MLISPYTNQPVVSSKTASMSMGEIKRFLEFEALLKTCGWQIVCSNCANIYGFGKDGVQGAENAAGTTLTVQCGCSTYVFGPDK